MSAITWGDREWRLVSTCCDADVATPAIGVFVCDACGRRLGVSTDFQDRNLRQPMFAVLGCWTGGSDVPTTELMAEATETTMAGRAG